MIIIYGLLYMVIGYGVIWLVFNVMVEKINPDLKALGDEKGLELEDEIRSRSKIGLPIVLITLYLLWPIVLLMLMITVAKVQMMGK